MRTNNIYPAIYIFSVSDQVVIVLWLHFGQRGGMPWSTGFRQVARCGKYSCSLYLVKIILKKKIRVKYFVVSPSESDRMGAKHNSFSHETVRKNYPSHPSETENENGF